jgi:hypothetical protein
VNSVAPAATRVTATNGGTIVSFVRQYRSRQEADARCLVRHVGEVENATAPAWLDRDQIVRKMGFPLSDFDGTILDGRSSLGKAALHG